MKTLIVGCGYVGTTLGRLLAEAGHEVHGLRRDPRALPEGIAPIAADLTDPASLSALPDRVDFAVYAASPAGFSDAAYRAVYVDGLRHVLARVAIARRLILVTSTSVYGQTDGSWVDESSPTEPSNFAGARLLEAEAIAAASGVAATCVRFAGIYGPGRTRLVRTVADGTARIPPAPVYTNRIHRDDSAGVLAHVMTLESPADIYVGVDSEPAELGVVVRWLADRLGVPYPPVDESAGTRRRGGNKRCSNALAVASGYVFRYPSFREGYALIVDERRGPPG